MTDGQMIVIAIAVIASLGAVSATTSMHTIGHVETCVHRLENPKAD